MIRINLLGQPRPKARRAPVPLAATRRIVLLVASLLLGFGGLLVHWQYMSKDLGKTQTRIADLTMQKARLEQLKQEIEIYRKQKAVLQQRIAIITELQRNRTGGQELLDVIGSTVARTDSLWLTSLNRKGEGLTIEGSAGSINAVANFITQLKRAGYFSKIEIKETRQDEHSPAVTVFFFTLNAEFAKPRGQLPAPGAPRKG